MLMRYSNYSNPYDRMKRNLKRIEMVDAWTQTSNHENDNENISNFKDIRIMEE